MYHLWKRDNKCKWIYEILEKLLRLGRQIFETSYKNI